MAYSVRLADLANMSRADQEAMVARLTREAAAPRNGQRALLDSRIRRFELRYEMTSEQLLVGLREGTIRETAEIADWLFWIEARDGRVAR
jgi:hypothetical protein